jgi:hypothetical protein
LGFFGLKKPSGNPGREGEAKKPKDKKTNFHVLHFISSGQMKFSLHSYFKSEPIRKKTFTRLRDSLKTKEQQKVLVKFLFLFLQKNEQQTIFNSFETGDRYRCFPGL